MEGTHELPTIDRALEEVIRKARRSFQKNNVPAAEPATPPPQAPPAPPPRPTPKEGDVTLTVDLYGWRPSFDPRNGPLTVSIEWIGPEGGLLIDRERGRARNCHLPGPDPERWVSPVGLILDARGARWGCMIVSDYLIQTMGVFVDSTTPFGGYYKRPSFPRDIVTCAHCGALLLHESLRHGTGPGRLVVPRKRLRARLASILGPVGVDVALGAGPERAGKVHDCQVATLF